MKRKIPRLNREVSALGLGCWGIGGLYFGVDGKPNGYSGANDKESLKALKRALDLGITLFDTADVYGCGHSEELLGRALQGHREECIIISKFGNTFNEETKHMTGRDATPEYIRKAVDASLRRLHTNYLDIYLLHIWEYPLEDAPKVMDTLDDLVKLGKIKSYGWSTDSTSRAIKFTERSHFSAIETELNIFKDTNELISLTEEKKLINLIRSPLAMGLLSGKYTPDIQLPKEDIRTTSPEWIVYFKNGKASEEFSKKLTQIQEILTQDGRSLVQGALGWILARSPNTIPLPGFKNIHQVEENIKTLEFGPLKSDQLKAIDEILGSRKTTYQ